MISFQECAEACLNDKEFLQEYDRLKGTSFSKAGSIVTAIDKATGKFDEDAVELFEFIRTFVWMPLAKAEEKQKRR